MHHSTVLLFIDDEPNPIGEYSVPINFELDTTKLIDGEHTLRIVSKGTNGKEGVRKIPFTVKNGPSIAIEGLHENDVVDGVLPIMINAYSKGDQKRFLIEGSETPHSIPAWLWVVIIGFAGWAMFYAITSLNMNLLK
ncbi:cytochrome C [Niabella insulamsoli]|uniref:cytochrome C n=1 Tax=Niabella insulamsoli TaxID=3144874 RepID=UPI0031FDD55B